MRPFGRSGDLHNVSKRGPEIMKKFVISAVAASMFASSAFAGSLVEPEMEPMVMPMEEPAASSSTGIWIPLLALVAVGLLISNNNNNSEQVKCVEC